MKKKKKGTVKAPLRLGPSTGPDLEEERKGAQYLHLGDIFDGNYVYVLKLVPM